TGGGGVSATFSLIAAGTLIGALSPFAPGSTFLGITGLATSGTTGASGFASFGQPAKHRVGPIEFNDDVAVPAHKFRMRYRPAATFSIWSFCPSNSKSQPPCVEQCASLLSHQKV